MEEQTQYWSRKFKEPFDLIILGEKISWLPDAATLVFDPTSEKAKSIYDSLEKFIENTSAGGFWISTTPTGPHVMADLKDPYTFVWAANSIFNPAKIISSGKAPTMREMGLSVGEFDKKKNRRIY